jgi:hypothetical protein
MIAHTFTFEEEDTCKYGLTFHLRQTKQGWIIDSVQVEEREKQRGCSEHPKTITALLEGRSLDSINLEGLKETVCGHKLSCGQVLAQCLTSISAELT